MDLDPYLWAAVLLPAWASLVWLPLTARGDRTLTAVEMGFLRHGTWGAIGTAVAQLHAGGQAVTPWRGTLARGPKPMRPGMDPLARAVYAALLSPTWLTTLTARSQVRSALRDLVSRMAAAGLVPGRLRWFLARAILIAVAVACLAQLLRRELTSQAVPYALTLLAAVVAWRVPRRSLAGYRTLVALRRQHVPRPPTPDGATTELPSRAGIGYALTGAVDPALAKAFARTRRRPGPHDRASAVGYVGLWTLGDGAGGGGVGGGGCGDGGGGGGGCDG